jgi:RNA polymerase primary sigma factor
MPEPIKLYLRDIKNIPLLTAEEERKLAEQVKKGSRAARKKMIQANLRLVINIAKRYSHLGVPMSDLIEEGNLGLIRAVAKFNPAKGYRFSTYCAWWIKQYIMRALANQGRVIKVPVYVAEIIARYRKTVEEMTHKLGRAPLRREIARRMHLPIGKVKEIEDALARVHSLDAVVDEDGKTQLLDLISEEMAAEETVDDLKDFLWQERIFDLMKGMTPREQEVLRLRFGLDDAMPRTLREVASELKITRERVRQIEHSAMKKLRKTIVDNKSEGKGGG